MVRGQYFYSRRRFGVARFLSAMILIATSSVSTFCFAETYWVENSGYGGEYGSGLTFAQAVEQANMNPGPDTIRFKIYSEEGGGVITLRCFALRSPLTLTDTVFIDAKDEPFELSVVGGGLLLQEKGACVSYTGDEPALTFAPGSSGSVVNIDHIFTASNATAFHLCAENLAVDAWLSKFGRAMSLCDSSSVSVEADLIVNAGESGMQVIDEDLPPDASIKLDIGLATGKEVPPITLNLQASECGGVVSLSGYDSMSKFSVSVEGCVNLTVDRFHQYTRPGGESRSVPFLTTAALLPEGAPEGTTPLMPVVDIVNVLLHGSTLEADVPLIMFNDTAASIRHSTIVESQLNGNAIIRAQGGSLLLDHSIVAENNTAAIQSDSTDIELKYSIVHGLQRSGGTLTEDAKSNAWRLNQTAPDLLDVDLDSSSPKMMPSLSSPALNAGDPLLSAGTGQTPLKDVVRVDRVIDSIIDIGAFERNFRPVFDVQAAVTELRRQRASGRQILSIDLNNYFSDPEGNAVEVGLYILADGVSIEGSMLIVQPRADGFLGYVSAKDSHGAGNGHFEEVDISPLPALSSGGGGAFGLLFVGFICLVVCFRTVTLGNG